jgi:hypothetical protein
MTSFEWYDFARRIVPKDGQPELEPKMRRSPVQKFLGLPVSESETRDEIPSLGRVLSSPLGLLFPVVLHRVGLEVWFGFEEVICLRCRT